MGFNYLTTNDNEVLRAFLNTDGSFLKNIILGIYNFRIDSLLTREFLCVYLAAGTGTIEEFVSLGNKKFAVEFDGTGYIVLITNSLESDSSSNNIRDAYFFSFKQRLTSTGIAIFSNDATVPTSYEYVVIGDKKLKFAVIGGRKLLVVKSIV